MPQLDFVTALGRLLRDGSLRDSYAASPAAVIESLHVCETERGALLNLYPDDLETQAQVLLRKRYHMIQHWLPEICSHLGDQAWPEFLAYSRFNWPSGANASALDASGFIDHLRQDCPKVISIAESNRIRFAIGYRRVSAYFVRFHIRGRTRPCVQLFIRWTKSRWNEHLVYLGL